MLITKTVPKITWEELPEYYLLPDEPVDNIAQSALAATLKEILELAGIITPEILIATNFGICATVDGQAEKQRKKAELLAERLRSLGIDPDSIDRENDQ